MRPSVATEASMLRRDSRTWQSEMPFFEFMAKQKWEGRNQPSHLTTVPGTFNASSPWPRFLIVSEA